VGGVNIVLGDESSRQVTLSLRDVPWDMALRVTLLTVGLDMEWVGDVIYVDTTEALAARRQARIERYRQCLETAPLRTTVIRLAHARAAELLPLVRSILTERGRAVVDERTNSIVIRDVDCPADP
jgi:type IV pilus assembly protein PilQ